VADDRRVIFTFHSADGGSPNAAGAAELTALCESLRARALAGEQFDTNDLTRLESTAARAERALVKGVEASEPEQTHEEMIAELYGKDYARDQ
jgi:hypothetical protein